MSRRQRRVNGVQDLEGFGQSRLLRRDQSTTGASWYLLAGHSKYTSLFANTNPDIAIPSRDISFNSDVYVLLY